VTTQGTAPPGGQTFAGPAGQQGHGAATGSAASGEPSRPGAKPDDAKTAKFKKSNRPNWALPQVKVNSIGVRRPIQVVVQPQRLVIIPERGEGRPPTEVPISPQLAPQDVEAFVGAVQQEMKSWGLAVQNGYWKPQIMMDVAPEAEAQCRDLQIALEGSGFELERKLR
jgi:hypothetical protein